MKYILFKCNQDLLCSDLKPAAAAAKRVEEVGAGVETGTETGIETETGRGATALVLAHAPDRALLTKSVGSAGVAGILAADPGVQAEETERKAQTAGGINMWTGRPQRSLLWVTSTMAKSPASCSLVASCSWKG